jgi:hypothetical protein
MNSNNPFKFYTERRLVALRELMAGIRWVPGASIFYHTHQRFLSQHYQKPVVYNDFAIWVSEALQEEELAEKLSAIDLRMFYTVRRIREVILLVLERFLQARTRRLRESPPGDDFHFCKSKSFIMPTGIVAQDPKGFFLQFPRVTNISIYFHLVEAPLRLEQPTNDFSMWFLSHGEKNLASAIDSLDPYSLTLDELKGKILEMGKDYGTN